MIAALLLWLGLLVGSFVYMKAMDECHEREVAAIDALVLERNGALVTDVSESERESFAEDFGCKYPKESR